MSSELIRVLSNEIESLSGYIRIFEDELKTEYEKTNVRIYFRGEKQLYEQPCVPSLFREGEKDVKKLSEDEIYYRILRRQPEDFYWFLKS
ncbi:MAG TPA: hypothetical protein PKC96_00950 [Bacilli bacterium]|nr:hypothetical protein [Bacilli bacterium]